jgi:hypothetical protein
VSEAQRHSGSESILPYVVLRVCVCCVGFALVLLIYPVGGWVFGGIPSHQLSYALPVTVAVGATLGLTAGGGSYAEALLRRPDARQGPVLALLWLFGALGVGCAIVQGYYGTGVLRDGSLMAGADAALRAVSEQPFGFAQTSVLLSSPLPAAVWARGRSASLRKQVLAAAAAASAATVAIWTLDAVVRLGITTGFLGFLLALILGYALITALGATLLTAIYYGCDRFEEKRRLAA